MHLSVNAESCGTILMGLNKLISPNERWVIGRNQLDSTGYNYTAFEKVDILWNYTYTINNDNAIAMRSDVGFIIPLDKDSYIPYEKGFYLGTSNSMRGWSYRGLGPGSYQHGEDTLYTGDIKIEVNLEYRGTIYRSFKYGIFADVGNIWLSRKNDDMPGAEFASTVSLRNLRWMWALVCGSISTFSLSAWTTRCPSMTRCAVKSRADDSSINCGFVRRIGFASSRA